MNLLIFRFEHSTEPKQGFLSGLALRVPFLSYFISTKDAPELKNDFPRNDVSTLEEIQTSKVESETAELGTLSEVSKSSEGKYLKIYGSICILYSFLFFTFFFFSNIAL